MPCELRTTYLFYGRHTWTNKELAFLDTIIIQSQIDKYTSCSKVCGEVCVHRRTHKRLTIWDWKYRIITLSHKFLTSWILYKKQLYQMDVTCRSWIICHCLLRLVLLSARPTLHVDQSKTGIQRKTNRCLKDTLNYITLHDLHMNVTHILGFWGSNLWSSKLLPFKTIKPAHWLHGPS